MPAGAHRHDLAFQQQPDTAHIGRHDSIELLDADLLDRAERGDPGVVEGDVQSPEAGNRSIDEVGGGLGIGDIGRDYRRDTAPAGDCLGGALEFRLPAAGEHHFRALPREGECGGAADPAPGSGDQGDLAGKRQQIAIEGGG